MARLDDYFLGLDTVRCEACGVEFMALYDEAYYDGDMGGGAYGDNVPSLTVQEDDVALIVRGDVVRVEIGGAWVEFKAVDGAMRDGTGLAEVVLKR